MTCCARRQSSSHLRSSRLRNTARRLEDTAFAKRTFPLRREPSPTHQKHHLGSLHRPPNRLPIIEPRLRDLHAARSERFRGGRVGVPRDGARGEGAVDEECVDGGGAWGNDVRGYIRMLRDRSTRYLPCRLVPRKTVAMRDIVLDRQVEGVEDGRCQTLGFKVLILRRTYVALGSIWIGHASLWQTILGAYAERCPLVQDGSRHSCMWVQTTLRIRQRSQNLLRRS